jgi:hypothetical protein
MCLENTITKKLTTSLKQEAYQVEFAKHKKKLANEKSV